MIDFGIIVMRLGNGVKVYWYNGMGWDKVI